MEENQVNTPTVNTPTVNTPTVGTLIAGTPNTLWETLHVLTNTNQYTYSNPSIGCHKEDAGGSCGSCSFTMLALLREKPASDIFSNGTDILGIGFKLHRSHRLTNGKGEVDVKAYAFTHQIIDNIHGVEEGGIPTLYDHSHIQEERFQNLLDAIGSGAEGFLQVGMFFLMCKKNDDDSIEIYDSHGSCTGFNGDYGAYYVKFTDSKKAAAFLSIHRNLETANGPLTQVLFHPVTFNSDFNIQNIHR